MSSVSNGFLKRCIAIVIVGSLLLSFWGALVTWVPNPDSVLYLRAADLFVDGRWADAMSTYRWPLYSLLIAAVKSVTGLETLLAAQVVNTVLVAGTSVAFIALADLLFDGDRAILVMATAAIILQPQLTELRPWVIRDHGYWCFLLASIYFAIADNMAPALWRRLALIASLTVATAFRIEGLYIGFLILVYYLILRIPETRHRAMVIAGALAASLVALPAFSIWITGTFDDWASGEFGFHLSDRAAAIYRRVKTLEEGVLFPGSGHGWFAYFGLVAAITVIGLVRALTPVYTAFAFLVFVPRKLVPDRALFAIVWFTAGQIPLLFLFTFVYAFLNWRHAMGFALIACFGAIVLVTVSWRELTNGRLRAFFLFPFFWALMVATWIFDIPRPHATPQYRQAGDWLRDNAPPDARIWMNDVLVAYYSDRPYGQIAGVAERLFRPRPDFAASGEFDILVVAEVPRELKLAPPVKPVGDPVVSFSGDDGGRVSIYAICDRMAACDR